MFISKSLSCLYLTLFVCDCAANNLGVEGTQHLAPALKGMTHLRDLDMSMYEKVLLAHALLKDDPTAPLPPVLPDIRTITELNLACKTTQCTITLTCTQ